MREIVLRRGRVSIVLRPRVIIVAAVLIVLGIGLAAALLGTGTLRLSAFEVWSGLRGTGTPVAERILWRIRVPRVLTAALVGAALGMAGAVFQSVSRNPLGSPDIIGFTTGAATGAVIQIILFNAGPLQTALAAVIAGLMTAAVVMLLARDSGYRLVLVGIGVGAVLTGVKTLLLVKGDLERAVSAQLWLAGSLNARNWGHVVPVAAAVALCTPVLAGLGRRMAVLEMGDDLARQLGLNPGRLRLVLVLLAVCLTSVATAAAGPIAFIALAAPQIARRLVRAPGIPVVTAALCGAVALMAADLLSLRAPFGLNLPIGLTTGILGGAYLLRVLTRR